ncbi:glycosyltransferase family 2 protein [Serratia proteamaculans]|uniref:Glycosyltransferase family 2 protein n=1 Tax=Serratia proteamaculans TaxID=28151 RepID=A0ABS0TRG1_SERPR|nr:glycosyltransferase family 2 protein [Serratia proteamaculans]MBI6180539.1 glycosyltransferase family 2 protein [Serratia proteamaculans]
MSAIEEKMPIVASIVLYKHKQGDIQPTIDSLLAEPLIETIVLVDNASSEWASNLNNPRIAYIKSAVNGGYGHGHNQAMDKYLDKCKYFIICNPDIAFEPGTVTSLYNFAESGGHRFIAPKIIYPSGEEQRVCRLLPTPAHLILRRFMPFLSKYLDENYELQNADYNKNFFAPTISGCFMFVESALLKQLQGFDLRYFMYLEDVDLCRKVLQYEKPMFCSEATVTHAFAKGSYKNLKLMSYHIRSAITYFNKWGWFFDAERRGVNKKCIKQLPRLKKQGEEK